MSTVDGQFLALTHLETGTQMANLYVTEQRIPQTGDVYPLTTYKSITYYALCDQGPRLLADRHVKKGPIRI